MVVLGEFVVARGDAAPVLETAEGALNDIALPIRHGIERMSALPGRIVGDDRLAPAPPQPRSEGITVVGRIRQAALGSQVGDQGRRDGYIALMPRADEQPTGAPSRIDGGMEFGRAAPPRPANGLVMRPPFPPAADRCTLTGVESSSSATGGPPAAASSANTWSQTPLRAQRTNRLYSVLDGP